LLKPSGARRVSRSTTASAAHRAARSRPAGRQRARPDAAARADNAGARIIILSMYGDSGRVSRALAKGAKAM
jgi:hypothetical protein